MDYTEKRIGAYKYVRLRNKFLDIKLANRCTFNFKRTVQRSVLLIN